LTSAALPELASVPWRPPIDAARLRRFGRLWTAWTVALTVPFVAVGCVLVWIEPLAAPVALASWAHAWIIPELQAFRGASVARRKGARHDGSEPVAQGFLGDLLDHEPRELQRRTGLVLERGWLGMWLVGEAGAILITPRSRRAHCFCVRVTDGELPPSDRIAHLVLALRSDEVGFATVANHSFSGAIWRVRRRLPREARPALDVAAREA
jgi:hypothetical protein